MISALFVFFCRKLLHISSSDPELMVKVIQYLVRSANDQKVQIHPSIEIMMLSLLLISVFALVSLCSIAGTEVQTLQDTALGGPECSCACTVPACTNTVPSDSVSAAPSTSPLTTLFPSTSAASSTPSYLGTIAIPAVRPTSPPTTA